MWDDYAWCAIRDGEAQCSDGIEPPPGEYVELSSQSESVCGLTLDGTIECWSTVPDYPTLVPDPAELSFGQ